MDNPTALIAARTADLRVMLDEGTDHFEGIDKDDALRELLDLLDTVVIDERHIYNDGSGTEWLRDPRTDEETRLSDLDPDHADALRSEFGSA